jgi:hypothetical protein
MRMVSLTAALLLAGGAAALLTSCDPCAGFVSCYDHARLTITGRVMDEVTAKPASGVLVDFVRTGGAPLNADSIRGVVDGNGNFTLSVGAPGFGFVDGEMVLRSGTGAAKPFGYRVFNQRFRVTGDGGDANVLPVWSTKPSLPDIGQLYSTFYPQSGLVGVRVEFRRTGGVALIGGDVFQTVTDQGRVFPLFDRQVEPADAGDIIGELRVDVQGFTITGLRVRSTPEFRRNAGVLGIEVTGPAAPVSAPTR